jgi:phospholipid/cholesterol/gamma-HCH transport system ATP-binding protein
MAAPPMPLAGPQPAASGASSPVIIFDDVSISFEGKNILDGISFKLERGETRSIFGVAGSGKSTILKLALGLLKPDSGRITVLGKEITEMREEELFELRRQIGIVFQESALFDSLNVRDNVAFRLIEEGHATEDEVDKPVREALSFVELANTIDLFPSELSGGMRRRVAIARAIITHPEILLYDSPTGGLDPVTSTTIIELIVKQRDVAKTSALMVTHRLQDAFMMATHYFDVKANAMQPLPHEKRSEIPFAFMILRDGKIIFDGDLEQLVHAKDPYIQEYIS